MVSVAVNAPVTAKVSRKPWYKLLYVQVLIAIVLSTLR